MLIMITVLIATDIISDDNEENEGIVIIYLIHATILLVLYIVINIIIISIITRTAIINLIIVNITITIMSTFIMMNNILLVITLSIAYFLLPSAISLL